MSVYGGEAGPACEVRRHNKQQNSG